jgi:hypothetical protein
MNQIHAFKLTNGLIPTVEVFFIEAEDLGQKEDAGWYYQIAISGQEIGDPQGPYRSDETALNAARGVFGLGA